MKTCTKCGVEKPLGEFYKNASKKDGLRSWCKACDAAQNKARRKANPEKEKAQKKARYKANPEKAKAQEKKRKYPWSEGDSYEAMVERQQNVCPISGLAFEFMNDTDIHVDHCHETNIVRGVLYGPINRALGGFRDNPEWLRRAADYLEGKL